jgi:hypothetical protein
VSKTYETSGARCPHCGHLHRPDGGYLYDEDLCEMPCESCEKVFAVLVYTSTSWTCDFLPSNGDSGAGEL